METMTGFTTMRCAQVGRNTGLIRENWRQVLLNEGTRRDLGSNLVLRITQDDGLRWLRHPWPSSGTDTKRGRGKGCQSPLSPGPWRTWRAYAGPGLKDTFKGGTIAPEEVRHGQRRRYTPQFKRQAVQLLNASQRPAVEIARELGIHRNRLYPWQNAAAVHGGTFP